MYYFVFLKYKPAQATRQFSVLEASAKLVRDTQFRFRKNEYVFCGRTKHYPISALIHVLV